MLTLKQKLQKNSKLIGTRRVGASLMVAIVIVFGAVVAPLVGADDYEAQINAIKQDSYNKQENLIQLGSEAASIQEQINKLQAQINALQEQINVNQAKSDELKKKIAEAEAELLRQRKVLGESIRSMYVEGQISTLEMLASSKDLSDFVDKQQYRSSVQNKIKATLDQITALKLQLKTQQEEVEQLLKDQRNMQSQLAGARSQQNSLLTANQQQQNSLNQQLKENSSRIAQLRAEQLAANARLGGRSVIAGDPGRGGYPAYLDNAPKDALVDPWGMYNRECVSYTAWKVYSTYGHMPYWGGHGNANQWPASARADGIPTGSTPRPGSVAVYMGGYYGHVMWVEGVSGDYIHVSQYNYDLTGRYSEMTIKWAGLTFIYFQ